MKWKKLRKQSDSKRILVGEKGIGREGYRGISELEMKVVETEDGKGWNFERGILLAFQRDYPAFGM